MEIFGVVFILLLVFLIIWGMVKSAFNSAIKEEPFKTIVKDLIREVLNERDEI